MGRDVIIIIDMVVGFLEPGHPLYCGDASRAIIPEVVSLLKEKRDARLLYLVDNHAPDDREFRMFPPHCIRGTRETEIIPELALFPGKYIPKTRYSGFYGTDLERVLNEIKPDSVTVVGVCTDICVMYTVADLLNRDYVVAVPERCVTSFDLGAHRCALRHMKTIGAAIV